MDDGAISLTTYKLIELALLFALPFVFGVWQLRRLRRLDREDRDGSSD
jgi:cytochrome oxidase assembly protein ShyY1